MPADFDRCVQKVMKQGKSKSSAFAICTDTFKKAGKKFRDKQENISFNYNVPIAENFRDEKEFMIAGIAISETTTSNGHKFIGEELRKSAGTLTNVPLLKDHDNSVDSIVGRVRESNFDEAKRNISFKAQVNDQKIQALINRGDLNTVSIGASVDPKDIDELDDGTIIPRNITFKELSLVAVPADSNATFDVALKEAYSHSTIVDKIELEGGLNMAEETTKEPEKPEEEKSEEPKPTEDVEATVEAKLKVARIRVKEKELAKLEASLKEADVDEEKPEEPKEESKEPKEEAEEEEVEEVTEGNKFLEGRGSLKGSSFTLLRNKY